MPNPTTYCAKGTKRVDAVTTGNTMTRISVAFTATAAGDKFKPIILIPRKRPLKNFIPPRNVEVIYGTSGTFNSMILIEHFVKILDAQVAAFSNNDQSFHLLIDSAPCHTTEAFKQSLETRGIKLHYVPPRLTNILQPADVAWMKSLKQSYRDLWDNWMINAPKTVTASNNVRSPGYALVNIFKISNFNFQKL